jgi:hypothetical protein
MNSHLTYLPAPSEQMLSYKLSITTQDFFKIFFIGLKKEGTLPTTEELWTFAFLLQIMKVPQC